MMSHHLFLTICIPLALWSDTAQSISLKQGRVAPSPSTMIRNLDSLPDCNPDDCTDYCEETEKRVEGSYGHSFNVVDIKDQDWGGPEGGDKHIDKRLMCLFKSMQKAAKEDDADIHLKVVSGFRTLDRQKFLRERAQCEGDPETCTNGPWIEKPGESDHFDGIAIDILTNCDKCKTGCQKDKPPDGEPCDTDEMVWLEKNAGKYNLISDIKGSPGHFRYEKLLSPVLMPRETSPTPAPTPQETSPDPCEVDKNGDSEWNYCHTYAKAIQTCSVTYGYEDGASRNVATCPARIYDPCKSHCKHKTLDLLGNKRSDCCKYISWWNEKVECCCVQRVEGSHKPNQQVTGACKRWAEAHKERAEDLKPTFKHYKVAWA